MMTKLRIAVWSALAIKGAMLVGCSSTGGLPAAPRQVDAPTLRYMIGPLDNLNIVVWRNPDLSGPVTVRPDGYISMPLLGEIKAAGRSPEELANDIKPQLLTYVKDPGVSVVVTAFQGVYADQIRIVGEAARPQAVPYRQNMTLLDVMIQVGGVTDYADGNSAVLIRGSQDGKQFSIRIKDLLKRGDISANISMLPGDIVMVPQSWF